jgi:hypothetical protein
MATLNSKLNSKNETVTQGKKLLSGPLKVRDGGEGGGPKSVLVSETIEALVFVCPSGKYNGILKKIFLSYLI